jgi:flagellar assembly protein FliH
MSSNWRVKQFEYPIVANGVADTAMVDDAPGWNMDEEVKRGNHDKQGLREAQVREIGRLEGETKAKVKFEESLRVEHERISSALRDFQIERARYFEQVEFEVVQLALAIAKRVLRREAQVDPDLLTGLVRYTLEKLREGTQVKLRVHPGAATDWSKQFDGDVHVIEDAQLPPGTCTIETEVGTTALSVDTELKEIENGLMDLLAQRPVLQ